MADFKKKPERIALKDFLSYHCPFEIRLCSGKGGMAVSTVWKLVYFLAPSPSESKEQTSAHRRDALCPSSKIQKQAAFGMIGDKSLHPNF